MTECNIIKTIVINDMKKAYYTIARKVGYRVVCPSMILSVLKKTHIHRKKK